MIGTLLGRYRWNVFSLYQGMVMQTCLRLRDNVFFRWHYDYYLIFTEILFLEVYFYEGHLNCRSSIDLLGSRTSRPSAARGGILLLGAAQTK